MRAVDSESASRFVGRAIEEIKSGEGRVVIGTFRHDSSRIVDLRIEGLDEPIGTTSDHPFWSRDRAEFVEASLLRPGERLLSIEGESLTVESVSERVGSSVVRNLEIQGLHTYTVSTLGVVVHNNCATGGAPKVTGTHSRRLADDLIARGTRARRGIRRGTLSQPFRLRSGPQKFRKRLQLPR